MTMLDIEFSREEVQTIDALVASGAGKDRADVLIKALRRFIKSKQSS